MSRPHQQQVLIDLTTSHPTATRELAALAAATGREYVDCGMTGGAAAADAGRLRSWSGARGHCRYVPADARSHASNVIRVGESGAGHAMKLIHNMICHTIFLATGEGCRLAERLGIPLETAIAVINSGNARSFVSERRFPDHVLTRSLDGRSRTANLAKDLGLAADLARQAGQPCAYSTLAADILSGLAAGPGRADFTTLPPPDELLPTNGPETPAP